jgi:probable HAF family extracellular repeat protein
LAFGSDALAANAYIARNLGTLGGTNSYAYGLNDLGDVVGEAFLNESTSHAYLYHAGDMTDLGTFNSPGFSSAAMGINNSMQIAGFAYFYNGYNTVPHAFRLSAPGGVPGTKEDLGTLGGSYSWATGINAAGVVVGKTYDSNYFQRGFTYDSAMHDMGDAGYPSATIEPTGINNAGQVSGYAPVSTSYAEAFRWQNGVYTGLGKLDSTLFSWGYAINNNGVVVGASNVLPEGSGAYRAVRFTAGGTPVVLGSLGPQSTQEAAYGINDAGVIVGQSNAKAFVYLGGQMLDLNTLTAAAGHTLSIARGVNKYGQIIADGLDGEGHLHAFLLTPFGYVKNAGFLGGNLDGWNIAAGSPSQVTVQQLGDGNFAAQLTTASPASIWQNITTPTEAFDLKFDFQFETTGGTLAVYLASTLLASIDAPLVLPGDFATITIRVTDPQLFGLSSAWLELMLDGPSGSSVLLDEITTSPVPEPGTLVLLAVGGLTLLIEVCRRRQSRHHR